MATTGKRIPEVATDYGYPRMMFYRVIKGDSVNQTVRNIIANLVNKPVKEIWPELAKGEK